MWELVVTWLFWTAGSFVPIQSCCKFKQESFMDSRFLSACFITWLNCKYILRVSEIVQKVRGGAPSSPRKDSCGSFYQEAGRRGWGELASGRFIDWWIHSCVVMPNSLGFTLLISFKHMYVMVPVKLLATKSLKPVPLLACPCQRPASLAGGL